MILISSVIPFFKDLFAFLRYRRLTRKLPSYRALSNEQLGMTAKDLMGCVGTSGGPKVEVLENRDFTSVATTGAIAWICTYISDKNKARATFTLEGYDMGNGKPKENWRITVEKF